MERQEILDKHQQFLFPCVANYYQEPIILTEGKGSRVRDVDGREYLDFFGGILTVSMGHCQPEVVEAIVEQSRRLGHVSTLYPTENLVRAAERLAKMTPGELKSCFFSNSGTEADETAIMLAKVHTGRHEIIALRHAYSGRSALATTITAHSNWRPLPAAIPGIVHGHPAYCYRCPFGLSYPSCDVRCAHDLEELIQTVTTGQPAAFIAEPIQGVGGFVTPPPEYFQVAVGIVRKYGGLFICDEVQTGFGRTGGKWFGIEHYGVEPDIMTFAKGIANGMPVGATIAKPEIAASMSGLSLSTFGGNPVSMAATNATLDLMVEHDLPTRVARQGKVLRDHLEAMKERFDFIGDVRGMGLMQAIELVEDRQTKEPAAGKASRLMETAKEQGLLLGKGGRWGNVLRIAPPMLIDDDALAEGCTKLEQALAGVK
ncbi:MAG: aspartate aminotransferase family protein [Myxococcales bacterium]|nr:aspartate aminotransferase family protein [Myxococcales bacterium]MCB9714705.1 aspartate aminotransferase family protein [Myxococcales bacterium]